MIHSLGKKNNHVSEQRQGNNPEVMYVFCAPHVKVIRIYKPLMAQQSKQ